MSELGSLRVSFLVSSLGPFLLVVGGMGSCFSCPFSVPFCALYFFLVLRSRCALCFLLRSLVYGIAELRQSMDLV
jgi:hypothetical protein